MSTITSQTSLIHSESGLSLVSSLQRTSKSSAFTSASVEVLNVDETLSFGDVVTAHSVSIKLLSGDDLQVGFASGTYPMRLSGDGDTLFLRLNVEAYQEISTVTTIADVASSLSGDYFDITDRTGTVRVWFDMAATAAFGSITYGVPAVAVAATGTLTLVANPSNNDTCTIGAKTYTFKTALTPSANEVLIGAAATNSIDNLIAAITAGSGSGTLYAAATTVNADATAAAGAGDTMTVTALTAGYAGNSIATTETFTNAGNVFGAATLTGGLNTTSVVVNGTTLSYTEGTPGAAEFSSITELDTLVDAIASISSTSDGTDVDIVADTAGTAGNSITLALGSNIAGTTSVSGATLTGGTAASSAPGAAGVAPNDRLLPVVIVEDSTADEVATAIAAEMDLDAEFSASATTNVVTIIDANTGTRANIAAGTSGMTVATTQNGAAGIAVHLKSAGTSQVVVAIAPT